ncbi:metal-dependent hydrolase [Tissierella creatinini]|nr:metal-dependent hydrolase [Tissierella creatinini]TJX67191.1 metal-dependent hydrolase [Soehngenia saccharolytica]
MTIKVYRDNPYLKKLEANVVEKRYLDEKFYIKLDKTIFYPNLSGGQPGDMGFINDIEVLEAYEDGDDVVHVISSNVSGNKVKLTINWERRLDIMHQHTGQHLLSAVFYKLFNGNTVGFNIGDEYAYIDITLPDLTEEDVVRIELLANKIIQSNFNIKSYYVDEKQLKEMHLSKSSKVKSNIRIVEIEGLDYNPCGGTHLKNTGELGILKIIKWERRKGNIRVQFICGNRALKDYIWKNKYIKDIALLFSSKNEDVLKKVEKLYDEKDTLEKNNRALRESLNILKGEDFLKEALIKDGIRFVYMEHESLDFKELSYIAGYLNSLENIIQIHGIYNGDKGQLYISTTKDIDINLQTIYKNISDNHSIKGGGNPHTVQGGTEADELSTIMALFLEEITKELRAKK